jgi:DNA polymerase-3 subunit delta
MTPGQSNAFLIVGEDPFLVEEALAKLVSEADELSMVELGSDEQIPSALEALRTPSMLGGQRTVVIREVQDLGADALRELLGYLEAPSPDSNLVLVATKSTSKLSAAVKKTGRVIEVTKGRRSDLFTWLRTETRTRGLKVSGDAMGVIVEAVGEERMALANALDELALALGKGGTITPTLVRTHFSGRADTKLFGFIDAVATKDAGAALDSMHRLIGQGEAPQVLFWTLTRHFRMLLAVEGSVGQVSKELGLPAWRAEKLVKQANLFARDELVEAFQSLAEADRKIKTSEESDELALERAVVSIARKD